MSDKKILVRNALSASIMSTRATARVLFNLAMEAKCKIVELDFSNIEFASRSFLDELNCLIENQSEISVRKTNLNEQVEKMEKVVKSPKAVKSTSNKAQKKSTLIYM
ncbi:MAG: STAS-like domain-containing protein [Balneolaceae bacterium]|nr:STAS-like domain-containing protein [Balneolaceae bacterium]